MDNEQITRYENILYISEYGNDENETIIHALTMPVSVTVYIDDNGKGCVEFREKTDQDNWRCVCQTGFIHNVEVPVQFKELKLQKNLEETVAKTVATWISIYIRNGIFCTDSKKQTFVSYLDLRDIASRIEKNLEDVYNSF